MKKITSFILLNVFPSFLFASFPPKQKSHVPSLKELASSVVAENTPLSSENINILKTYPKEIRDLIFSKLAKKYLEKKKIYSKVSALRTKEKRIHPLKKNSNQIKQMIELKYRVGSEMVRGISPFAFIKVYKDFLFVFREKIGIDVWLLAKDRSQIQWVKHLSYKNIFVPFAGFIFYKGFFFIKPYARKDILDIWQLKKESSQIKNVKKLDLNYRNPSSESSLIHIHNDFLLVHWQVRSYAYVRCMGISIWELNDDPSQITFIKTIPRYDRVRIVGNLLFTSSKYGDFNFWHLPKKTNLVTYIKQCNSSPKIYDLLGQKGTFLYRRRHSDIITPIFYKNFFFQKLANGDIGIWKLWDNPKEIEFIKRVKVKYREIFALKIVKDYLISANRNPVFNISVWKLTQDPKRIKLVQEFKNYYCRNMDSLRIKNNFLFDKSDKDMKVWRITNNSEQPLQFVQEFTGDIPSGSIKFNAFDCLHMNQSQAIVKFATLLNKIKEEKKAPDILPSSLAKHFYKLSRPTLLPEEIIDGLNDEFLALQRKYSNQKLSINFRIPSDEVLEKFKQHMTHKAVEKRNSIKNYYWNKNSKKETKRSKCTII